MRHSQKRNERVKECQRETGEYDTESPMVQFGKMVKEVGELVIAIGNSDVEGIKDAIGDVRACLIGVCGSQVPMKDILSITTSLEGIADAWDPLKEPEQEEDEHIFWQPGELPECFRGKGYVEELEVLIHCLWSSGCRGSLWETNAYCMKIDDYERLTAVEHETPEETLPDGWIAHTGNECPVDPDVEVMVRIAEDEGFNNRLFWGTSEAEAYRWDKLHISHEITHYKVVNALESSVTKKSQ